MRFVDQDDARSPQREADASFRTVQPPNEIGASELHTVLRILSES